MKKFIACLISFFFLLITSTSCDINQSNDIVQLNGNYIAKMSKEVVVDDEEPVYFEWDDNPIWVSQNGRAVSWLGLAGWAEEKEAIFDVEHNDYSYSEYLDWYYHESMKGKATLTEATFVFDQTWYRYSTG